MTKLLNDNRVVGALFLLLAVLNAFALMGNWYA